MPTSFTEYSLNTYYVLGLIPFSLKVNLAFCKLLWENLNKLLGQPNTRTRTVLLPTLDGAALAGQVRTHGQVWLTLPCLRKEATEGLEINCQDIQPQGLLISQPFIAAGSSCETQ